VAFSSISDDSAQPKRKNSRLSRKNSQRKSSKADSKNKSNYNNNLSRSNSRNQASFIGNSTSNNIDHSSILEEANTNRQINASDWKSVSKICLKRKDLMHWSNHLNFLETVKDCLVMINYSSKGPKNEYNDNNETYVVQKY